MVAGTFQRMTPEFKFEDGKLTSGVSKEGMPLGWAAVHSIIANTIEVASEHGGEFFKVLGETESLTASRRRSSSCSLRPKVDLEDFFAALKRGEFHGTAGEMWEEAIGKVAHYYNGDEQSPVETPDELALRPSPSPSQGWPPA